MPVTIRPALSSDAEAIATVHVRGWQASYRGILPDPLLDELDVAERAKRWSRWVSGPGVHTFVACAPSGIIGFTRLAPARPIASPPPSVAEVTHLYVDPAAQAGGVGRKLLQQALDAARRLDHRGVLLWVLEANGRARRFYEHLGFERDGARRTDPDFLGNDAAEVRYVLWLRAPGD